MQLQSKWMTKTEGRQLELLNNSYTCIVHYDVRFLIMIALHA